MTLRMQGLLLRFLETGDLQKVGADDGGRRVNVRVLAATNRQLRDMVAQGAFREDLFYRLNVIHLVVPPLRERAEDVPLLVEHVLGRLRDAGRSTVTGVSPEAMKALTDYAWPGNVRELENIIERAVVSLDGGTIGLADLSAEIRAIDPVALKPRRERRRTIADELVRRMFDNHESFWDAVYPLFMSRDLTRNDIRAIVSKGLEEAHGHYKIVVRLFNMAPTDYKRFLNFLRKHDCQVPFKAFR
jgi:DNA-binding NtrC family response regulator